VTPLRLENAKLKEAIMQWEELVRNKDEEIEDVENEVVEFVEQQGIRKHLKTLLGLSWPIVLVGLIQNIVWLSSTFFVSHIGDEYLAAAALGNMICNSSGLSFGIGLGMALDTLCAQAFGAKKYKLVGLHFQRSIILLTLVCIPIITLWLFTEKILLVGGVEPEVARLSQLWVYCMIPGLWPVLINEGFKRYLLAQQIVLPLNLSVFVVSPLHLVYTYLLLHYSGLGYVGAAIATSITNWLWLVVSIIAYLGYLRYKRKNRRIPIEAELRLLDIQTPEQPRGIYDSTEDPLDTWPQLSTAIFRGWVEFLKLGVPASFSLAMEWGSWEINALIVAQLSESTVELASHSVLANTAGLWYTPPNAIASAVITCMGNSLGAKRAESAKLYCKLGYVLVLCYAIINGLAGVLYRNLWGKLWSDDMEVATTIADCMWVMWAYGIVDVTKCVGNAVIRGCGHPTFNLIIFVTCTLFVGYPLSYLFGFVLNYRLNGIWTGMTFAWVVVSIIDAIIVMRTDWKKEVADAIERNKTSEQSTKDSETVESVSLTPVIENYLE
jgi:MATE family multidrug resistance protein